jgi:hypothetical protein
MWLSFAALTPSSGWAFILYAQGRGLEFCAVDLLPSRLKLQIFVDMPWRIRLATIAAPFKVRCCTALCQGYAQVCWMMLASGEGNGPC